MDSSVETLSRPSPPPVVDPLQQIRLERDRYVAFAFAAADLLLELGPDLKIVRATGASQTMVGRDTKSLVGVNLTDLVAQADRGLMNRLVRKIAETGRVDWATIRLDHPAGKPTVVRMGGSIVPSVPGRIFISFGLSVESGMVPADAPRDAATGLLDKAGMLEMASRAARDGLGHGDAQLTLVSLDGLSGTMRTLPPERAAMLIGEISASLRAMSAGGDAAGRLGEEQFGVVAGASAAAPLKLFQNDVERAAKLVGINPGLIGTRIATMALAGSSLAGEDVAKSLVYAVNQFVKTQGRDFTVDSLEAGLSAALAETVQQFGSIRTIIAEGSFELVFQPVVALDSRLIHHHEALSRFPDGRNAFETIRFSEEIGIVPDLDLAVCRRAIEMMDATDGLTVAVNLSGRSVQTEGFRQTLGEMIRSRQDLRTRLLFELTESAAIENIEDAANFLRWLRRIGHAVCLDDFGAGAAAYAYLRQFDIDFVKIDGPFLKAAVTSTRERALIRSICTLCKELNFQVIGEMIEDEAMAEMSSSIGIQYGQGYHFGKPTANVIQPKNGRRKGTVVDWS